VTVTLDGNSHKGVTYILFIFFSLHLYGSAQSVQENQIATPPY